MTFKLSGGGSLSAFARRSHSSVQKARASMIANLLCDCWPLQCPNCQSHITIVRSLNPKIDSSGFETYGFSCGCCKSSLGGIVDPIDDTLLISMLEMSPEGIPEAVEIVAADAN
jgi:hypothetical protein